MSKSMKRDAYSQNIFKYWVQQASDFPPFTVKCTWMIPQNVSSRSTMLRKVSMKHWHCKDYSILEQFERSGQTGFCLDPGMDQEIWFILIEIWAYFVPFDLIDAHIAEVYLLCIYLWRHSSLICSLVLLSLFCYHHNSRRVLCLPEMKISVIILEAPTKYFQQNVHSIAQGTKKKLHEYLEQLLLPTFQTLPVFRSHSAQYHNHLDGFYNC